MLRLGVLALAAYAASALPPAPVPEEQYREPDLNSAPSGTPATKEYDTKYAWGDSKDYTPGPKPACCDDNSCRDSTSWFYKKQKHSCESYIAKKAAYYCKKAKYVDESMVQATVACPVTCNVCGNEEL